MAHPPDSKASPYTIVSAREVYDNPWINVVEHQILTPQGNPSIYGVVRFKNRAVGVVPYDDGHIHLVGQYRFPLHAYSWEIPEGGAPPGEDLLTCARRELKEETGLSARSWEPLLQLHLSNSVSDEYGMVFLARGLEVGEAAPEEMEQLDVRRVPLAEAYRMVGAGELTDSLTVAAVLKMQLLAYEGKLG